MAAKLQLIIAYYIELLNKFNNYKRICLIYACREH